MRHDGRLDVLCCIVDGGPLGVSQLSARTGAPPDSVRYWVEVLEQFHLVERLEHLDGEPPSFVATLDEHPPWIREAVERHRRS